MKPLGLPNGTGGKRTQLKRIEVHPKPVDRHVGASASDHKLAASASDSVGRRIAKVWGTEGMYVSTAVFFPRRLGRIPMQSIYTFAKIVLISRFR